MSRTQIAWLRLRIIGYFNVLVIFLGLTRFRIDFVAQRVVHSRLVAYYVICANIGFLFFLPIAYIYEVIDDSTYFGNNLLSLTGSVSRAINFAASAFSVFLRSLREAVHLEIAETIIVLDRRYFSKMPMLEAEEKVEAAQQCIWADRLLYFKMFALCMQILATIYYSLPTFDELDANEAWLDCYYVYTQSILASTHFMYCYQMWLLWKRFGLLNVKVSALLRRLQRRTIKAGCGLGGSDLRQGRKQLALEAVDILRGIAQTHACLSHLLERLNEGYLLQILVVLLASVIESITFGYSLSLVFDGSLEWEFDFDTYLFCMFICIMFIDFNLVYWISDRTVYAHGQITEILRRFQLLPFLGVDFEQHVSDGYMYMCVYVNVG